MTRLPIVCLSTIAVLFSTPVTAQEYQGDWWINPQSGRFESFNFEAGIQDSIPSVSAPIAQSSVTVPDGWLQIGELVNGDILLVNPSTQRTTSRGLIEFQGRVNQAIGSQDYSRVYQANCQNPELIDIRDVAGGAGAGSLPLIPGTVADALWSWACQ